MADKSHVSLEQHQCVACGRMFDTGNILLDKRLRASMERHTTTGLGMCPEHQAKIDEGFVILVGADPTKSQIKKGTDADTALPIDVYRTGDILYIKREAWTKIFNTPAPEKGMGYAPPDVIEMLKAIPGAQHMGEEKGYGEHTMSPAESYFNKTGKKGTE